MTSLTGRPLTYKSCLQTHRFINKEASGKVTWKQWSSQETVGSERVKTFSVSITWLQIFLSFTIVIQNRIMLPTTWKQPF